MYLSSGACRRTVVPKLTEKISILLDFYEDIM
jgi:hypothetical protein